MTTKWRRPIPIWHSAEHSFLRAGELRVTAILGKRTQMAVGGCLTSGKGHVTEVTLVGPVKAAMIRLAVK
jgi:hypothetical protein